MLSIYSNMKDFRMTVDVTYDNYQQRSIRIMTEPEGVKPEEVREVIKSLKSSLDYTNEIDK